MENIIECIVAVIQFFVTVGTMLFKFAFDTFCSFIV